MADGVDFAIKKTSTGTASLATDAQAVSAGRTLIVGVVFAGVNFTSISDNNGGSYSIIGAQQDGIFGRHGRLYYAPNVSSNGSLIVTLALSGSGLCSMFLMGLDGLVASPFNTQANATSGGGGSGYGSGNATPSVPRSLLVGWSGPEDNTGDSTSSINAASSPTSGWTKQIEETSGSTVLLGAMYTQLVESSANYAFNYDITSPVGTLGGATIAAFERAAAPGFTLYYVQG